MDPLALAFLIVSTGTILFAGAFVITIVWYLLLFLLEPKENEK